MRWAGRRRVAEVVRRHRFPLEPPMLLTCPTCRSGLEVPDGTTAMVRCPACKRVFSPADGVASPKPKPAPGKSIVGKAVLDDDDDDRPRRKPSPAKPKAEEEEQQINRDFDLELLERKPQKRRRPVEEDDSLSPR